MACNFAPGADGFTFKAWEALGPTAVDILCGIAQVLKSKKGSEELIT